MRVALIDADRLRLLELNGKRLIGECRRCGACCKLTKCELLGVEMVDDKPRHFCKDYHNRSMRCTLWPYPGDPIPEGCGFHWEKI